MSKLSRFKKPPVVKLTKVISSPKHQRRTNRFGGDDSDSDDDFIEPLRKPSKIPSQNKPKPHLLQPDGNPKTNEKDVTTPSTSISEYFQIDKLPQTVSNDGKKVTQDDICPENINASPIKSTKHDVDYRKNKAPERIRTKNKGISIKTIEKADVDDKSSPVKDLTPENGILCPFCWKKLGDKLTGTIHIKSCAKNIPIPQIYEAMQLQDKQIKEWQNLGLEFPGFSNVNKKVKSGTTKAKATNRKRRQNIADPDLELAIALSRSLQEEIDHRENVNIIESETKNQIKLVGSSPSKTPKTLNEFKFTVPVPSKNVPSAGTTRRRGKKTTSFENLPLHTVSLERKKAIVSERVSRILDESEKKGDNDGKFYVRDDISPSVNYVPKNLARFQRPGAPLWNLAQALPDTPKESFLVLELPDSEELIPSTKIDSPSLQTNVESENRRNSKDSNFNSGLGNSIFVTTSHVENNNSFGISKCAKSSTKYAVVGSLPDVIRDIVQLFINKTETDVVIYGREEKPIHCHRLILLARCPNLLKEMVMENIPGSNSKAIIPLTTHTHEAVKAFIWYLYTGNVITKGNEKLLTEIQDLGNLYGIKIVTENKNSYVSNKSTHIPTSVDVQVQTEPIKHANEMHNKSLNDGSKTSSSQELFQTFIDNHVSIEHHQELSRGDFTSVGGSPLPMRTKDVEDLPCDLDDACSVDLFEDSDEDKSKCPSLKSNAEIKMQVCGNQTVCPLSAEVNSKSCHSDDEDFLNDLISPTQYESSLKKRSRSVSPYLDDSNSSYTATQIVNILKVNQDGGDVDEYIKKAIKKPKLDFNDSYIDKMCDDDFEVEKSNTNASNQKISNESENRIDSVFNVAVVAKSKQCSTKLITPITPSKPLSLRKSMSTPNLTLPNYSSTPLYHQQIKSASPYDPLVDACDDSVFANIPEFEFSVSKNIPKLPSDSRKSSLVNSGTPSRLRRGVSPRVLTSFEKCSIPENKGMRKERQTKAKTKSQPKIRLPRHAQTQENPPVRLHEASSVDKSKRNYNNTSPMLNYSLIDTPILKQELNKFGIKPLPRSKAKVLLRHIYKETHK